MSEDCVFCAIVDGEIPSYTLHEDETTMAFLDANPIARGHTVVIPKAHHGRLADLPGDVARDVFGTMHSLVPDIAAAVDADGTNLGFNDGEVAGQAVPHVHGHVVPRFEGDGGRSFHAVGAGQVDLADEEMGRVAAAIRGDDG